MPIFFAKMILACLLGWAFWLTPNQLQAQSPQQSNNVAPPLILNDSQDEYALNTHLSFLEDPTASLSFADIRSAAYAPRFEANQRSHRNFGYTRSVIWVRFELDNQSQAAQQWYIEQSFSNIHYVSFFRPQDFGSTPNYEEVETGIFRPFETRDVLHHLFVFQVDLPPGEQATYYLRLQSEATLPINLTVWSETAFDQHRDLNHVYFAVLFGILLMAGAYNTFIWLSLRERSYFYYVLLVFSVVLYVFSLNGLFPRFLWPDSPWVNRYVVPFSLVSTVATSLALTNAFLKTKTRTPNFYKAYVGFMVLCGLVAAQIPFFSYQHVVEQAVLLIIISPLFMISIGIRVWQLKYQEANLYLLGWSLPMLLSFALALSRFAPLPYSDNIESLFELGLVWLFLFLSLALADRINIFRAKTEAMNAALKANQHQLNQYLEALPLGVVVFNQAGKVVYANQATRKLFQVAKQTYRQPQLTGMAAHYQFRETETGNPYPPHKLPGVQALQGESVHVENLKMTVEGQDVILAVWSAPIFNTAGQPELALSIFEDISQRHHIEQELESYRTELEALVAARTEALEQEIVERKQIELSLEQAKDQAEAANRAKSIFLANMSHELRTPLNGILGYAQILNTRPYLRPTDRKGISIIQESGSYLLSLINDILDISKIEAGKVEISPAPLRLADFLDTHHQMLKVRAAQKNLYFRLHQAKNLPSLVNVDEKRLHQVLINLLGNAIKFTQTGGVSLNVTCQYHSPEAVHLHFEVCDTGPGIEAEVQELIFHPFHQLNTTQQEGTGLGLSISRNLVKLMGGHIGVNSTPGEGSCFYVELTVPVLKSVEAFASPPQSEIVGVVGARPKVLLVDDMPNNLQILQDILNPLGFACYSLQSAVQALRWLEDHQPDLIITDIVMPDVDGLTLTERIHQQPNQNNVVIFASSASVYQEDQHRSLAAGCDAFLPKPIKRRRLLELIGQHLALEWHYASPTPAAPHLSEPLPPAEVLHKIHQASLLGDISAVEAELLQIQDTLGPEATFVSKVQALLDGFQLNELSAWLETLLAEGKNPPSI